MFCHKCGKEVEDNSKFCNHCGVTLESKPITNNNENVQVKPKRKIYNQTWFWGMIIIGMVIFSIVMIVAVNKDKLYTETTNNEVVQEPIETREEYISKCENYDYKEIARNPNNYIAKRVKFTGKVIQVQEKYNNNVVLRVNVTKNKYENWEDTIWINYRYADKNESKILEDDIIDIYGELQEQKSYISILGSQVTLPQINAKYIDIQ